MEFSFFATGTKWQITINPKANSGDLRKDVYQSITTFENNYSRFKNQSYPSILRNQGYVKNPPDDLLKMVKFGKKLEAETNGHFNLAIGNILENNGYDKNYSFYSKKQMIRSEKNWLIQLNSEILEVKKGTLIDFGSFGKGYLIDLILKKIKNKVSSALINSGGDLYYFDEKSIKKTFFLENPFNKNEYIGSIDIVNSSIASSSNNKRTWIDKRTGKKFTHINSFKNKNDANIVATYTYSKSAMISDALATSLFLVNNKDNLVKKYNASYLIIFNNKSFFRSAGYPGKLNLKSY